MTAGLDELRLLPPPPHVLVDEERFETVTIRVDRSVPLKVTVVKLLSILDNPPKPVLQVVSLTSS